jgi:RNA polymerase sigma-70 factor (ECF subfamily)
MMSGTADPAGNTAAAHDGTDLELLTHVAQGDQEAMATLYGRYERLTFGLALRITKDPTLAEDVVQDAMVGVWRNASRYASERGSVRTWMMSITGRSMRSVDAGSRASCRREMHRRPRRSSCPTSGP